jgi:hypothetical protein
LGLLTASESDVKSDSAWSDKSGQTSSRAIEEYGSYIKGVGEYLHTFMGTGVQSILDSAMNALEDVLETVHEENCFELRETHPRMPWHDVHCGFSGPAARDVGLHFVQVREQRKHRLM